MTHDRKDANHDRLRAFARRVGWFWRDMPRVAGFDAVLAKSRRVVFAEVKVPGEELSLTDNERETHRELAAHGITIEILTCEADVLALDRPMPLRREG